MSYAFWLVLGFILIGLEIIAPTGFFLMFLGGAALLVGALAFLMVAPELTVQLFIFSAAALILLALFWKRGFRGQGGSHVAADVDRLVGQIGTAEEAFSPGIVGRVEFRGSAWNAKNVGEEQISVGDRCIITAVEGLRLDVRKK